MKANRESEIKSKNKQTNMQWLVLSGLRDVIFTSNLKQYLVSLCQWYFHFTLVLQNKIKTLKLFALLVLLWIIHRDGFLLFLQLSRKRRISELTKLKSQLTGLSAEPNYTLFNLFWSCKKNCKAYVAVEMKFNTILYNMLMHEIVDTNVNLFF